MTTTADHAADTLVVGNLANCSGVQFNLDPPMHGELSATSRVRPASRAREGIQGGC